MNIDEIAAPESCHVCGEDCRHNKPDKLMNTTPEYGPGRPAAKTDCSRRCAYRLGRQIDMLNAVRVDLSI